MTEQQTMPTVYVLFEKKSQKFLMNGSYIAYGLSEKVEEAHVYLEKKYAVARARILTKKLAKLKLYHQKFNISDTVVSQATADLQVIPLGLYVATELAEDVTI